VRQGGGFQSYATYKRSGGIKVYVTIDNKYFQRVRNKAGAVRVRRLKKDENYSSPGEKRIYPRRYAHLVEFGTAAHMVGKGSSLKRRSSNFTQRADGAEYKPGKQTGKPHPGSAPQPFMRPAFDENVEQSIQIMSKEAEVQVGIELEKLRKQGGT
jgi:HK97 gp10 family phage protein